MLELSTAVLLFSSLASSLPAASFSGDQTRHSDSGWRSFDLIGQGSRIEHSVAALSDSIYAIGGAAFSDVGELETVNRVEYLRPSDRSWHVAAPIPQPLNHLNVAEVDDHLYLLGALSGGSNWTAVGESYVYHPSNDSWTSIAPMPKGTARGSCAVGSYDGSIYLAGGMNYLAVAFDGLQDSVTTVTSYNIETNTWNADYPPLPGPRQHVGGAVVDSTFYVIGGREDGIEQYRDTVYALDLNAPSEWRTLAPMPTARGGLACATLKQEIYCFGGEGNPESPGLIFNETEVYNTRTDEWKSLPPMAVPRHGTGVVAAQGSLWIPGGGLVAAGSPTGFFDSFMPAGSAN